MPDAGEKLTGCSGSKGSDCNPLAATAGNGIIGNPDFIRSLKPQVQGKTRVPPVTAGDETILFWNHLLLTNYIGGVTYDGMKNGSEIQFGKTLPAAKFGGGFIVGYSDGTALPPSLSPPSKGLKGTILVEISDEILNGAAELNTSGRQALKPLQAAQIDRKMDDGRPLTGYVRGFGAPDCLSGKIDDVLHNGVTYNETNSQKDCNLIYLIDPQP